MFSRNNLPGNFGTFLPKNFAFFLNPDPLGSKNITIHYPGAIFGTFIIKFIIKFKAPGDRIRVKYLCICSITTVLLIFCFHRKWLVECWWQRQPRWIFPSLWFWGQWKAGESSVGMWLLWTVKLWWSNTWSLVETSLTPTSWLVVVPDLAPLVSRSLTRRDPWTRWGRTRTGPSSWPSLTPWTWCPSPGWPSGHTVSSPVLQKSPFQDISIFLQPQDLLGLLLRLVFSIIFLFICIKHHLQIAHLFPHALNFKNSFNRS